MHAELDQEPLPQDESLSSRLKYYALMSSAILAGAALTVRRDPRARWVGMAALGVVLVLAYGLTRNSPEALASSPSPSSPAVEKTSQPIVRSSGEIEALKAALAQQNATNQQLVTSIDELRAEQDKLRRQVAALQAAKPVTGTAGTAGVTGSIAPRPQPKPLPTKKAEQSDPRPVPYPAPEARHVPYPKPN